MEPKFKPPRPYPSGQPLEEPGGRRGMDRVSPKLYTKTGDRGKTAVGQGRGRKSDLLPELLGEIDELNSLLGGIVENYPAIQSDLSRIQRILMRMSSYFHGAKVIGASESDVGWLETEIDRISGNLPIIREFILPRGQIHVARAVCRRAERRLSGFLAADASGETDSDLICLQFMNRLSDYLFALAREHSQPDVFLDGEYES